MSTVPVPAGRSRRGPILLGVIAAIGAAAGTLESVTAPDPYLAHLEARIAALRPAVERELGAPLPGPLRVVISTRAEIGELTHRELEEVLHAVEGEDPGGDARGKDEREEFSRTGTLACVDADATIHVCREELEGRPHDDDFGQFLGRFVGPGRAVGPDVLDGVLVHELVHVYQARVLGAEAYHRGSRHRSDMLARAAVAEGHAIAVTTRVLGSDPSSVPAEDPTDLEKLRDVLASYNAFESVAEVRLGSFAYAQGSVFVESAIARLGREAAVRRLFTDPPSLMQVAHPDTWPGPVAPEAGTDGMLRRARRWLGTEWKKTECGPLPAPLFLGFLDPASPGARSAAADALLEAQRIEAKGAGLGHAVRGHLLAAGDEGGARAIHDAWVEAARARDAFVPRDPKLFGARVRESVWTSGEIDGLPVLLATRRYRSMGDLVEHAVVARRGRYVLEIRLVEDPGGEAAALRLARRLLACIVDAPDRGDPGAPGWDARWRFAVDGGAAVEALRPLLGDPDPDVRQAALVNLLRRGTLSPAERTRSRADGDPLVRLTALTWSAGDAEPDVNDLLSAIEDPDPWVAAGGWHAASAHIVLRGIPAESVARALHRPEVLVRRAASRLLDLLNDESPEDLLVLIQQALADEDPGVRERGAGPLLLIPGGISGLGEAFTGILTGPDGDLRRDALIQLSIRDGVPGTAAALIPFLEDEEDFDLAAEALCKAGPEGLPAVPALRRIAAEADAKGDAKRRLDAIIALAGITGDRAETLDVLRRYLSTGTDREARLAVDAVKTLGATAELMNALAGRLRSKDRRVVLKILDVIEDAGAAGQAALPAIATLCGSADPGVRRCAREAMEKILKSTADASEE